MQAEARLVRSQRAHAQTEACLAESKLARSVVEQQLAESRRAGLDVEHARDDALRAVARAEAAAHDANARAEVLARRLSASEPGTPRSTHRAAGAAAALGLAAVFVAILAWPARDDEAAGGRGVVAAASAGTVAKPKRVVRADPLALRLNIPADYLALYRRAGARYGLDWTRLAAIGAIESGHGQARMLGITTGASARGAIGPAQFLPGTWERFGLDGDGDGTRDPRNPADAILAMASYLRASGAPGDWRAALRSYNHSDAYVAAVETLAASLRSSAS
jgi:membrane-bound lytic murein transglycosylase B